MASKLDGRDGEREIRQAGYDIVAFAAKRKVTPRRLEQYFQTYFHEPPHVAFTRLKLEDAKQLVEQGLPIKEVASRFGYHPTDFIAAFRRQFGCTPRQHFKRTLAAKISLFPHFPSLFPHNASQIPHQ